MNIPGPMKCPEPRTLRQEEHATGDRSRRSTILAVAIAITLATVSSILSIFTACSPPFQSKGAEGCGSRKPLHSKAAAQRATRDPLRGKLVVLDVTMAALGMDVRACGMTHEAFLQVAVAAVVSGAAGAVNAPARGGVSGVGFSSMLLQQKLQVRGLCPPDSNRQPQPHSPALLRPCRIGNPERPKMTSPPLTRSPERWACVLLQDDGATPEPAAEEPAASTGQHPLCPCTPRKLEAVRRVLCRGADMRLVRVMVLLLSTRRGTLCRLLMQTAIPRTSLAGLSRTNKLIQGGSLKRWCG